MAAQVTMSRVRQRAEDASGGLSLVGMGVAFQGCMDTTRQRQTTSYAGITRIRCEGLRSVPHSQPNRLPCQLRR
ncbi:hypothetical protein GCM10028833_27030 [Glycomyces tarimensis]